jgi:hypothetical protein
MFGDGFGKAGGDKIERHVPARALPVDLRVKNTSVEIYCFRQGRALGT